ncbi:MAG: hypothetical protein E7555_08460 [Ruminococcaceae bacterium]|nr:hypothetical protein [Oscillospiraceae bacterium]
MKRLNFTVRHPGCVRIRTEDASGKKYFYIETEGAEKSFSADIVGESFDLILTPMSPQSKPSGSNKLGEKIVDKLISAGEKYAKDMYFFTECVYHVENFNDGDEISLNQTVYSFRSNDAGEELWMWTDVVLFPVQYMFYDAVLNGKRLEPKEIACLNRKKVLKRARPFMLMGEDGLQIISYPLQWARIRRLSTPKKIYSTLLEFSKMDMDERLRYTEDDNFIQTVDEAIFDNLTDM